MPTIDLPSSQIDLPDLEALEAQKTAQQAPATPVVPEATLMRAPDGKIYKVPATSLGQAHENGWKSVEEEIEEKAQAQDPMDVLAEKFADEASLGARGAYRQATMKPEELAIEEQVSKRASDLHPYASAAGKVGGFVAPLLIPGVGELGEAVGRTVGEAGIKAAVERAGESAIQQGLERSLASKVASSAAKYATEGALYSTPQAAVQAVYGDPEQAAETMLWGIGLGGVLGAGGALAGAGAKAAVRAGSEAVSKAAEKVAPELLEKHWSKLDEAVSKDSKLSAPTASSVSKAFQEETLSKFPELLTEAHKDNLTFFHKLQKEIVGETQTSLFSEGEKSSFSKLEEARKTIVKMAKEQPEESTKRQMAELANQLITNEMDKSAQNVYASGALKSDYPSFLSGKNLFNAAVAGPVAAAKIAGKDLAKTFALNALMENRGGLLQKGVSFLRKAADDPTTAPILGGLMAKEGVTALQAHIDRIPQILCKTGAKASPETNPFKHLIGDATGLTKDQQYDKLVRVVNLAAVNAETTSQNVGHVASAFAGTDMALASMVAQKKMQALSYLQQQIPKNPMAPRPFQKDEWQPSKQQKQEFLNKAAVTANPMVVWDHYQKGTLTKADRDTLIAVYPKIYDRMVQVIEQAAFDPKQPKLDYQSRLQLSKFTGQPMDNSLKNVTAIQQAIAVQEHAQPQGQPKPSSRPQLKHTGDAQTDTQRRTYKNS